MKNEPHKIWFSCMMRQYQYRTVPGCCILACILLILPASALSEIYKWVDQKGRTHYGEKPPARTHSEQLHIKPSSSPPDGHVSQQEYKSRQRNLLRAYEEERLQREDNRLKAKQDKERRIRQCSAARDRQRMTAGRYRLYDYDKQGNRVYLDAQAIDRTRATADREVKRLCK